jgi:hypothetical protein
VPYKDPAKKREWERIHRPDKLIALLRKKDAERLEEATRLAYEESEEDQRKHAFL